MDELKCPKCGNDCKEYVTRFKCRNSTCDFEYTKYFQITKEFKELEDLGEEEFRKIVKSACEGSSKKMKGV